MKKLVACLLIITLFAFTFSAIAEESVFSKFQPYTSVDLSVLENAGYTASFDEFAFTAEFSPASNLITIKDSEGYDTYSIELDIKAVYSAGEALLVPRFIFKRKGMLTYFDDRMSEVYIRNGENRYRVNLSGVSRSSDSKNYSATDTAVEPIRTKGAIMLADLANNPMDMAIKFGKLDGIEIPASDIGIFKEFYDTCNEAGIFAQEKLYEYADDYYILTLFNEGSTGTEDVVDDEPAPESDGEQAD